MPFNNLQDKKEYEMTRYGERIQNMLEYLGGACFNCGALNNLNFHHRDQSKKVDNVSRMWSYKWETIVIELNKCDLLCDDCHRGEHS